MMRKTVFFAVMILVVLALAEAGALEIEQGPVKLRIYDNGGRFNVFINDRGGTATPFSYFVKDDPRTTFLQILVDNNIYTMGEENGMRQVVQKTETGAAIIWTTAVFRVTQEFIFLSAADSPLSEGVKILLKIENISEEKHLIGARYVFDTYLGEKANTHFVTSANATLAREASLAASSQSAYWISPQIGSPRGDGLLVLTDPDRVTRPDRVVFANWKRLYDSTWEYAKVEDLDFNYHPYSFNDSAACHYYNPQTVQKKQARDIVIIMGSASSYAIQKTTTVAVTDSNLTDTSNTADGGTDGTAADDKDKLSGTDDRPTLDDTTTALADDGGSSGTDSGTTPFTGGFSGTISKPLTRSNYDLVHGQIGELDEFIKSIDAKIQSGQPVTEAELTQFRALLALLENKALEE